MPDIAKYISLYFIALNALCFALFFIDKRASVHGARRIREHTLISLCILGGAPCGFMAMKLFRHKTKVREFRIVPLALLFWAGCGVYALLLSR